MVAVLTEFHTRPDVRSKAYQLRIFTRTDEATTVQEYLAQISTDRPRVRSPIIYFSY